MSKKEYISRYLLILKCLKLNSYRSFEQIRDYIDKQVEFLQATDDTLKIAFSKRTFQRDVRDIRTLFGIDIEYSRHRNGYYISQDESENMNFQRRMEAFDMFNSLNIARDLQSFIHLEERRPQGTENIYGIIHAIKNNFRVKFSYQKFTQDKILNRTIMPYGLKEFKNRWYIIGKDTVDNRTKIFGLDRLSNFEMTNLKFDYPENFNVKEMFDNCFGIIVQSGKPKDVILSFNPVQGEYIRSLPLHKSQKIIKDNEKELKISLKLFITYDFKMELLSYGETVKVVKPISLRKELIKVYEVALKNYK